MREIPQSRWRFRRAAVAVLAGLALATGCATKPHTEASMRKAMQEAKRPTEENLLPGASWIATAKVPLVEAFADPKSPQPQHRLSSPDENGTPLVFLVDTKDADEEWLPVFLPVRPNGSTAWIRSSDVTIAQTQYRIKVDLDRRKLTVTENGKKVLETPVGVGKDTTPTPDGDYYVKELIEPPNPHTIYGPYVFGLSGHSNVVTSLNGEGTGVIGIHGNNDPTSIGQSVSSGCIRLPNDVIREMAEFLPLGTPVRIVS